MAGTDTPVAEASAGGGPSAGAGAGGIAPTSTPPPPPLPPPPQVNWTALDAMVLDFLAEEGVIEVRQRRAMG